MDMKILVICIAVTAVSFSADARFPNPDPNKLVIHVPYKVHYVHHDVDEPPKVMHRPRPLFHGFPRGRGRLPFLRGGGILHKKPRLPMGLLGVNTHVKPAAQLTLHTQSLPADLDFSDSPTNVEGQGYMVSAPQAQPLTMPSSAVHLNSVNSGFTTGGDGRYSQVSNVVVTGQPYGALAPSLHGITSVPTGYFSPGSTININAHHNTNDLFVTPSVGQGHSSLQQNFFTHNQQELHPHLTHGSPPGLHYEVKELPVAHSSSPTEDQNSNNGFFKIPDIDNVILKFNTEHSTSVINTEQHDPTPETISSGFKESPHFSSEEISNIYIDNSNTQKKPQEELRIIIEDEPKTSLPSSVTTHRVKPDISDNKYPSSYRTEIPHRSRERKPPSRPRTRPSKPDAFPEDPGKPIIVHDSIKKPEFVPVISGYRLKSNTHLGYSKLNHVQTSQQQKHRQRQKEVTHDEYTGFVPNNQLPNIKYSTHQQNSLHLPDTQVNPLPSVKFVPQEQRTLQELNEIPSIQLPTVNYGSQQNQNFNHLANGYQKPQRVRGGSVQFGSGHSLTRFPSPGAEIVDIDGHISNIMQDHLSIQEHASGYGQKLHQKPGQNNYNVGVPQDVLEHTFHPTSLPSDINYGLPSNPAVQHQSQYPTSENTQQIYHHGEPHQVQEQINIHQSTNNNEFVHLVPPLVEQESRNKAVPSGHQVRRPDSHRNTESTIHQSPSGGRRQPHYIHENRSPNVYTPSKRYPQEHSSTNEHHPGTFYERPNDADYRDTIPIKLPGSDYRDERRQSLPEIHNERHSPVSYSERPRRTENTNDHVNTQLPHTRNNHEINSNTQGGRNRKQPQERRRRPQGTNQGQRHIHSKEIHPNHENDQRTYRNEIRHKHFEHSDDEVQRPSNVLRRPNEEFPSRNKDRLRNSEDYHDTNANLRRPKEELKKSNVRIRRPSGQRHNLHILKGGLFEPHEPSESVPSHETRSFNHTSNNYRSSERRKNRIRINSSEIGTHEADSFEHQETVANVPPHARESNGRHRYSDEDKRNKEPHIIYDDDELFPLHPRNQALLPPQLKGNSRRFPLPLEQNSANRIPHHSHNGETEDEPPTSQRTSSSTRPYNRAPQVEILLDIRNNLKQRRDSDEDTSSLHFHNSSLEENPFLRRHVESQKRPRLIHKLSVNVKKGMKGDGVKHKQPIASVDRVFDERQSSLKATDDFEHSLPSHVEEWRDSLMLDDSLFDDEHGFDTNRVSTEFRPITPSPLVSPRPEDDYLHKPVSKMRLHNDDGYQVRESYEDYDSSDEEFAKPKPVPKIAQSSTNLHVARDSKQRSSDLRRQDEQRSTKVSTSSIGPKHEFLPSPLALYQSDPSLVHTISPSASSKHSNQHTQKHKPKYNQGNGGIPPEERFVTFYQHASVVGDEDDEGSSSGYRDSGKVRRKPNHLFRFEGDKKGEVKVTSIFRHSKDDK